MNTVNDALTEEDKTDTSNEPVKLSTWKKRDRKARAIIGLSLSDEHLEHVRDVSTAKEMWKAITDVFERHTLLNKLSARRKFYTVTMDKGEKMLTYLNRVKQLASTLKSMNVDIDDKEIAMAALNGLPSNYESLIVALDALGNDDDTFTFDLVKSRLLQEEQRSNDRENVIPTPRPSALVGLSGSSNGGQKKYANYRCSNCGNLGHTEKVCWGKDINGKRPTKPNFVNKTKSNDPGNSAHVVEHKHSSDQIISESDFVCLMAKINSSAFPKRASSWITDSGCTAHICFDRSMFATYEPITDMSVEMGTKATADVAGRGTVILSMKCGSEFKVRKLEKVLHVPTFEFSLLSVSTLDKRGMMTTFGGGECIIHKDGETIATGSLETTLYVIRTKPAPSCNGKALLTSLQRWHERMGHVHKRGIVQMADGGVANGLKIGDRDFERNCHHCAISKAHRSLIPKERTSERAKGMLDRIHSDVCGPMDLPSLGGSKYFVTFIDEHSNWVVVYLMKQKSEVADCFLQFEKYAERQTGRKIRVIRSDRGGEYLSNALSKYLKHRGIVHELTAAYTPHQNGISERFNRTILNLVRSMLSHRAVPKRFWAEALSTAVHIRNRVTSSTLPSNLTPYHIWNNAKPDVSYFRVFGCKCWYTVPKAEVQKLDPRGKVAIFVGYAENSKAYKLIDFETGKVVISRDVFFDELDGVDFGPNVEYMFDEDSKGFGEVPEKRVTFETDSNADVGVESNDTNIAKINDDVDGVEQMDSGTETHGDTEVEEQEVEELHEEQVETFEPVVDNPVEQDMVDIDVDVEDSESSDSGEKEPIISRSGRVSKPPTEWWKVPSKSGPQNENALLSSAVTDVPNSFKQAVSSPDASFWKGGIVSEVDSLRQHVTWTLVFRESTCGRKVFTTNGSSIRNSRSTKR